MIFRSRSDFSFEKEPRFGPVEDDDLSRITHYSVPTFCIADTFDCGLWRLQRRHHVTRSGVGPDRVLKHSTSCVHTATSKRTLSNVDFKNEGGAMIVWHLLPYIERVITVIVAVTLAFALEVVRLFDEFDSPIAGPIIAEGLIIYAAW
jgi:hypothetical protein